MTKEIIKLKPFQYSLLLFQIKSVTIFFFNFNVNLKFILLQSVSAEHKLQLFLFLFYFYSTPGKFIIAKALQLCSVHCLNKKPP
jgi:hypothetical protein